MSATRRCHQVVYPICRKSTSQKLDDMGRILKRTKETVWTGQRKGRSKSQDKEAKTRTIVNDGLLE